MNIGSTFDSSLSSIRQAMGISILQKAMNKDGATVTRLLKDISESNTKALEISLEPYKGTNIDIKL